MHVAVGLIQNFFEFSKDIRLTVGMMTIGEWRAGAFDAAEAGKHMAADESFIMSLCRLSFRSGAISSGGIGRTDGRTSGHLVYGRTHHTRVHTG